MISLTVNSVEYFLPVQTAELQGALDDLYDKGRLSELVNPHTILHPLQSDWPTPPETDWPRPRLGSLFWPIVGCARYAFGTFLVDEYTLGQIRTGLTAQGTNNILVSLYDEAADSARTIPMQFLATRPLVRTGTDPLTTVQSPTAPQDAWVVVLVDIRYELLTNSITSLTTSSWSSLFSSLGVTVGDVPPAAYLTPGDRWTTNRVLGRSQAWLADIAAQLIGSRIVTTPGTSPTLQRPTSARAAVLAATQAAAVTALRFMGGGSVEAADLNPGMPNTLLVTFGGISDTAPLQQSVPVQSTYAWTATLSHWADPNVATAGTGTQGSALASQFESDWLAWQSGYTLYDVLYSGFIAAPASAFAWNIEWFHTAGEGTTRLSRPPHWYGYSLPPENAPSTGGTPTTGAPFSVVQIQSSGTNLQNTPFYITVSGPVTVYEILQTVTSPPATTTSSTITINTSTNTLTTVQYPQGPSGPTSYTQITNPGQITNEVIFSTGPQINWGFIPGSMVLIGNPGLTQGIFCQPIFTGPNVTSLQSLYSLWNTASSSVVTPQTMVVNPGQITNEFNLVGTTQPVYQGASVVSGSTQITLAGNSALTQGIAATTVYSAGNIVGSDIVWSLWNGSANVTATLAGQVVSGAGAVVGTGLFDFTGATLKAVTQSPGDNTTNVATTAFVQAASGGGYTQGTVAAAGTTQGTAAALTTVSTKVTGANGSNGVILQNIAAPQVVWNDASSNLNVYPPSGAHIAGQATNSPQPLTTDSVAMFWQIDSTHFTYFSAATLNP